MSIGDDAQIPEQSGATPPEDGPGTPTESTDVTDSSESPESAPGEPTAPQPNFSDVPTWQAWSPQIPTSDWHAPQPSGWPPQPPQPPIDAEPPAWPPQPSWPPTAQPYAWPPQAETYSRRRPSRLPQILIVVAIALIAFSGGLVTDRLAFGETSSQVPLSDFKVYEQALQIIRSDFVGRASVTDQQLLYGSISGLLNSLGDTGHSRFLTPDQLKQEQTDLQGQFVGIGVVLDLSGTTPAVDRVVSGSPAEKAGVKAGDQITAVDGKSAAGLTLDQLGAAIRGVEGTLVTLTVIHAGSTAAVDIPIIRESFDIPSVEFGMVPGTHVADIALLQFSSGASDQLQAAIEQAAAKGATGLVLDMRGNPGGLASEAIGVASHFLTSGVVYIQRDASGTKTDQNVDKSEKHTDIPIVVLVDHNTASAAEIVAGALQDGHRAKIVGVTTFGTGTVLQQYTLSDGSALFLGTADWLTPAGHAIFGVGIKPDQTVDLPSTAQPIDPADMSKVTAAQVKASGDTQLLAALADLGQ
jgi:carboxyl-terminal processing protease